MTPSKIEKKTHHIVVHVSRREKEAAMRVARKRRVPVSVYVRELVLAEASRKAA
jgi:hypothetical protein